MANLHRARLAKAPLSSKKQQGVALWLSLGFIVIILGILGGAYYVFKQNKEEIDLLHQYVEKIETELGKKNASVSEFQSNLAKIAADTESHDVILRDHLRTLEDNISKMSERVDRVESVSNQNWLLSEVEYLLKIAGHRILLKEDVKGAIDILKSAEELIKKLPTADQGLMAVRVAIAQDIASMEAYREVDVPGTYAALSALGTGIEKLPLIPMEMPKTEDGQAAVPVKQPKALSEINEAFAGYLTIRKHDVSELRALLSPEQRLNLRDSIRLALEQAQTGLLRGDQRIYEESLTKVRTWVLNYFKADNFRVKMTTKKLEKLLKVEVEHDLPDISTSQQELKRYIADRMRAGF